MESINPDDIEDLDPKQISIITLKNGNIITIDDTLPSKKLKNNKDNNKTQNNYQISQKLITLTIINKKEKLKELNNNININFNSKNTIYKNINFSYLSNNIIKDKDNNCDKNIKEKINNILSENYRYNDTEINKIISLKSNVINNNIDSKGNLKIESNKDEKEIEKIKVVDIDIDSKSNNEYKALIKEFDYNTKNKIKLESRFHNINNLLNSKVKIKESKQFDFANHLNLLVNNLKGKKKE